MRKKTKNGNALQESPKHNKQLPANGRGGNGSKPFHECFSSVAAMTQDKKLRSVLRRHAKAVRAHPDEAAHWFDYGKLLLDIGQNKPAEAALQEAFRRAPDSANYRYYLGIALENNDKFPEAATHFKHLADIGPELEDPMSTIGLSALMDLGYCLEKMGHCVDAFATLQPAVGTAVIILCNLARFLSGAGEHDRSCFLYSVALMLSPEDADHSMAPAILT
jgi:tetratricopeptide (TPR) repeat protein